MSTVIRHHVVEKLEFDADDMRITIDGRDLRFPLAAISKRLLAATLEQRRQFEVSASGYGIHWPLVDEDLSIDGLLKVADER